MATMTASPGRDRLDTIVLRPGAHLRYLDGLRGLAILAVLMVHTGQIVPGLPQAVTDFTFYGRRGVQLFFVVSGLTLTLNHAGRQFHPFDFARRRFLRIAPMFYIGAALYITLAALTTMPMATRAATPLDVAATLLFLHGWLPGAINTVVPGGWSIAAEAMFYVMFPVILLLARRPAALTLTVVATFVVAGVTSIALHRLFPPRSDISLYFWLLHLPAFASGCWLATLAPRPQLRRIAWPVLVLTVAGLIVDSQLLGRSNLLVAIVLLTTLTWAVGILRPAVIECGLMPLLGRISFSLYILHFAVLWAMRPAMPTVIGALGAGPALVAAFLVVLGVAGTLSIVTYDYIERPAIALARRLGAHAGPV